MHKPISEQCHGADLIAALRMRAKRCPGALALDGAHRVSWRLLLADAERCADELDVLDDPVVAWQLDNDWRWVVLDLACLLSGRIALPIPRFFTPSQRDGAMAAAGCRRLIVPAGEGRERPATRRLHWLRVDAVETGTGAGAAAIPEGTAKITFTSGSTGNPRGVCLSRSLLERVANALNQRLGALADRPHLATLPLAVLLENVGGLYRCLLSGARYVLPRPGQRCISGSSAFDAERLAAAIGAHAARVLIATPAMLARMTESPGRTAFRRLDLVAVGGAPLPSRTLFAARDAGIAAYEGYGLSECGSVVSLNVPADDRPGSVGRPLEHLSVRVRDGQVEVAGAGFLGYLGESSRNASIVATGDLGHLAADGHLHLHGRLGNRIVTPMGRNVSPEWIESELVELLPGHQLCVIDDDDALAVVIAGPADQARVATALEQTNRRLPDYARIERWVLTHRPFGAADGCLTADGRLRRATIRERFAGNARCSLASCRTAAADRSTSDDARTQA